MSARQATSFQESLCDPEEQRRLRRAQRNRIKTQLLTVLLAVCLEQCQSYFQCDWAQMSFRIQESRKNTVQWWDQRDFPPMHCNKPVSLCTIAEWFHTPLAKFSESFSVPLKQWGTAIFQLRPGNSCGLRVLSLSLSCGNSPVQCFPFVRGEHFSLCIKYIKIQLRTQLLPWQPALIL